MLKSFHLGSKFSKASVLTPSYRIISLWSHICSELFERFQPRTGYFSCWIQKSWIWNFSVNWPLYIVSAIIFSTKCRFRQDLIHLKVDSYTFLLTLILKILDTEYLPKRLFQMSLWMLQNRDQNFWPFDTKMPISPCWKFWFVPNWLRSKLDL